MPGFAHSTISVGGRHIRRIFVLALGAASLTGCGAAFAQGSIKFANDSLHLIYYSTSFGSLSGRAVSSTNGYYLAADLYMGTSSSLLYLYGSTPVGSTPGMIQPLSIKAAGGAGAPAVSGGTRVYIVVQVRPSSGQPPSTWYPSMHVDLGSPSGLSQEFTFVLGTSSIAYPLMTTTNISFGGGLSTWPIGSQAMDSDGAGYKGAIMVGYLEDGPPTIVTYPSTNQTVWVGTNVDLYAASGTPSSYQWQFNGVDIPSATRMVLSLTNIQFADAGFYRIFLSNYYGTATTSNVVLQVVPTNGPSIRVNNGAAVGTVQSSLPARVSITGGFPGGTIRYTLNGSQPTVASMLYTTSLSVTNSAVVTAMGVSSNQSQTATSPPVTLLLSEAPFSLTVSNAPSGSAYIVWIAPTNWFLELTPNIGSAWSPVSNAASPYLLPSSAQSAFYRLHGIF